MHSTTYNNPMLKSSWAVPSRNTKVIWTWTESENLRNSEFQIQQWYYKLKKIFTKEDINIEMHLDVNVHAG